MIDHFPRAACSPSRSAKSLVIRATEPFCRKCRVLPRTSPPPAASAPTYQRLVHQRLVPRCHADDLRQALTHDVALSQAVNRTACRGLDALALTVQQGVSDVPKKRGQEPTRSC